MSKSPQLKRIRINKITFGIIDKKGFIYGFRSIKRNAKETIKFLEDSLKIKTEICKLKIIKVE